MFLSVAKINHRCGSSYICQGPNLHAPQKTTTNKCKTKKHNTKNVSVKMLAGIVYTYIGVRTKGSVGKFDEEMKEWTDKAIKKKVYPILKISTYVFVCG